MPSIYEKPMTVKVREAADGELTRWTRPTASAKHKMLCAILASKHAQPRSWSQQRCSICETRFCDRIAFACSTLILTTLVY